MNNLTDKPFRITLEHHDIKVTIEKPYSDIDADQLEEMLRTLCLAAGWAEGTVKKIFGE